MSVWIKSRYDKKNSLIEIYEIPYTTNIETIVDQIIDLVKKNKIKGLIIDLRDNPGGLLTAASEIADELLPTGVITYTVDKKGNKEYIYSDSKCINMPIVVIVNENSASASEITAAAIKDADNGKRAAGAGTGPGRPRPLGDRQGPAQLLSARAAQGHPRRAGRR